MAEAPVDVVTGPLQADVQSVLAAPTVQSESDAQRRSAIAAAVAAAMSLLASLDSSAHVLAASRSPTAVVVALPVDPVSVRVPTDPASVGDAVVCPVQAPSTATSRDSGATKRSMGNLGAARVPRDFPCFP